MADLPRFMVHGKDTTPYKQPPIAADDDGDDDYDDEDDECLLELPDIRQNDTYSCGAAVAMSVGKYFGVGPDTLKKWKDLLGTTKAKSTDPESIKEVLTGFGVQCVAKQKMDKDDLCYHWKNGAPVICPIQEWGDPRVKASSAYGHYVAVVGVAMGYVFVQDPSIDNVLDREGADNAKGKMMIACEEWDRVWHDEGVGNVDYDHFGIACYPPAEDDDND